MPTTNAPWPPPTRFVHHPHTGPLAPRITLHCDDDVVLDDAELQLRIDELKKFTAIWQQACSAAAVEEEEDTHSNKKFNAHRSQKKRERRPS
jgi:hypothetical protein